LNHTGAFAGLSFANAPVQSPLVIYIQEIHVVSRCCTYTARLGL